MTFRTGSSPRDHLQAVLRSATNRRDVIRLAAISAGLVGMAGWPARALAETDEFGFDITPSEHDGGTSIMQLGYETNGMNPLIYDGWIGGSLLAPAVLVFDALLGRSPTNGELIPVLASDWSVAEDGVTWTFNLRDDVTWHDGTPFTAADVLFTYEAIADPEVNSFARSLIVDAIASMEAPDDHTVVMTATSVNSEFLNVGLEWIAPRHIWEGVAGADLLSDPGTTGTDPSRVIGTGPFKFVERVPQDHTTIERYDGYWQGAPQLQTIVWQHAPDSTLAEPLLRAGDLDWGWVSFEAADQFKNLDNLKLFQHPSLDIIQFGFNQNPERSPLFQDLTVRQAMLYALDRQAIVDVAYRGLASVAETFLLPDMWNNDPAALTIPYTYDPERAAALLDEAGWILGDDGVRAKDGTRFSFVTVGWDFTEQLLALAQEFWRAIGVETELQILAPELLGERIDAGDFDMTVVQTSIRGTGYDAFFFEMHSEGGNYTGYRNPKADELLAAIKNELDEEARIPLFTELQQLYLDELPELPIVHDWDNRVINNRLHNMHSNPYRTEYNPEQWWIDG